VFHSLPVRRTESREFDNDQPRPPGVLVAHAPACLGRVDEESSESRQRYRRRVAVMLHIGEMRHQLAGYNAGTFSTSSSDVAAERHDPPRKSVICHTNMAERLIVEH
jgi:hypothetical protein